MKKIYSLLLYTLFIGSANAQTIADAKKDIYYQNYKAAKKVLENIIAQPEASSDATYYLGEIYLTENDLLSANVVLSEATKLVINQNESVKKNALLFIGLSHLYLDSGMIQQAKKEMEEVLTETKYKDPEVLLAAAKANIESKNGDVNLAIELLQKALKKEKKNAAVYAALGDAYRKLIDGANAIINYNKAVELDPSFAEPMYKMGLIYKTQNNEEIYIEKFTKAYEMDSIYVPAIYQLYSYYFFKDVVKADQFLSAYLRHADSDPSQAYMVADLQYVSRKYKEAIESSKKILINDGKNAQPRLYKLMAYSYAALGDSAEALNNIDLYFEKQDTGFLVAKDYLLKAKLLQKINPDKSAAILWYQKAIEAGTDKEENLNNMMVLADLQKEVGNTKQEAVWREKIYANKEHPTNLDIYKWGIALYSAEEYGFADSVFAIYENKYPDQIYGYLWRAKSNAAIDTSMALGLAVPHYIKLIEIAEKDSIKNKALLLRAYQYLGAYEATVTKNYSASLIYYDKVLALNPGDAEADKNAKILSKWIEEGKGTGTN